MTLSELEDKYPALKEYTRCMPEDIRARCTVRVHPAGTVIHHKDVPLECFGIIVSGENRVINEMENGNIYMIERNQPITFIGEVTILAKQPNPSVTIEAVTDNVIAYFSRKDAERWLSEDLNFLRLVSSHVAFKLYRSSSNSGTKLFYPPTFLLLDYLVKHGQSLHIEEQPEDRLYKINLTRQQLQDETSINVKTLNRTISQLKDEGYISLEKGKICYSKENYKKAVTWLQEARRR